MWKVIKIRISIYTFSAHNLLFSSVKRLHILCPCMYCHYLPEQCLVKKKECLPYHWKNMTWQNYIHQGLYDVCVAKFHTCLISWSSPEIDMLDVCWGQPRLIILNWITLSQNTFSTLAKGCIVKERNIHYNNYHNEFSWQLQYLLNIATE